MLILPLPYSISTTGPEHSASEIDLFTTTQRGSVSGCMLVLWLVWLPIAPGSGPLHLAPGVPHPHQLLLTTPVVHLETKTAITFHSHFVHIDLILISSCFMMRKWRHLHSAGQRVGMAFHQLLTSDGLRVCGAGDLHRSNKQKKLYKKCLQRFIFKDKVQTFTTETNSCILFLVFICVDGFPSVYRL